MPRGAEILDAVSGLLIIPAAATFYPLHIDLVGSGESGPGLFNLNLESFPLITELQEGSARVRGEHLCT